MPPGCNYQVPGDLIVAIVSFRVSTRADMRDAGCFSMRDPLFAQAAEQGRKLRVFRWQVRQLWPRALQVIQSARNVPAAMNRKVSGMQGM